MSEHASLVTSPNEDLETKFVNAKAFLQTASTKSGDNVYDHLSKVLSRILTDRPTDAVDVFEDISKLEKREKFINKIDTLIDKPDKSGETKLANIQKSLFMREGEDEDTMADMDDVETSLPNLLELTYFFEQASVGIGREETFRIWLALKQLVEKYPLESIRFWGKLFGIEENYYVAEVKFQEGKDDEEEAEAEEATANEDADKDDGDDNEEADTLPKSTYKPPPQAPKEESGSGANKFVYYVCNAPGKPWFRLPSVTPQQITVARKIRKFLTGRLDAPIVSYPPFPGNESNYLRAQIARITAGTHISPIGFYRFDEEGEDEDDAGRDSYVRNEDFEGISARDLADPSLSNWVHHAQHILPQGRTRWWDPKQKTEDEEMDDEEMEEDREDPDQIEPESGPELLTPLSEDAEIDSQQAWTARISSNLIQQFAIAVVRSNLWPGAYAFAVDKTFENVYVGWGQKYSVDNLNPQLPPMPQEEYSSGPEITETEDPTPQDEEALRKAQEKAEEVEEGYEEEVEDEVDADDDD